MKKTLGYRCATAVLSLSFLAAAGCSSSDNPTGPESLAGVYHLVTVNGASLPYVIFEHEDEGGSYSETLVAGSLALTVLSSDEGTFTASFTIVEEVNGVTETFQDGSTGNYTVSGSTITLEDDDEPITGTVSTGQISVTLSPDGLGTITMVFQK